MKAARTYRRFFAQLFCELMIYWVRVLIASSEGANVCVLPRVRSISHHHFQIPRGCIRAFLHTLADAHVDYVIITNQLTSSDIARDLLQWRVTGVAAFHKLSLLRSAVKGVGRHRQGGHAPPLARKFFHFDH